MALSLRKISNSVNHIIIQDLSYKPQMYGTLKEYPLH